MRAIDEPCSACVAVAVSDCDFGCCALPFTDRTRRSASPPLCVQRNFLLRSLPPNPLNVPLPNPLQSFSKGELQRRLDAEKPRNHLDLRHRLDKHGKRYGRVIDYKLSELRAVELLEGLCEAAGKAHALVEAEAPAVAADADADAPGGAAAAVEPDEATATAAAQPVRSWVRTSGGGGMRRLGELGASLPPADVERHMHSELTTFCGALIDRHEDDVVSALQRGELNTGGGGGGEDGGGGGGDGDNDDEGGDGDGGGTGGVAVALCERIARRCEAGEVARLEASLDAVAEARRKDQQRRRRQERKKRAGGSSDGAEGADDGTPAEEDEEGSSAEAEDKEL